MNDSADGLDRITWLPNRALFEGRLSRAVALALAQPCRSWLALLYIDLDRFQDVNELFGHERGDRVLREAAVRISRACPNGATLARLGGDDFAALVKGVDLDKAAKLARGLLRCCSEPYIIECVSVVVTASIGIGLFPLHAKDGEGLMRSAERALYRAKLSGRNCMYPPQPTCFAGTVRLPRTDPG